LSTTNLNLTTINSTDVMKDSIIAMNDNMIKIDTAYGYIADNILEKTGATTIVEAVSKIDDLVNAEDATATASDIRKGKTAYVGKEKITGTAFGSATTANASTIFKGKKAYISPGTLITGTALGTATTATADDILDGKTAYTNAGALLTGTAKKEKTINVELTGTNATTKGYVSGYGAGINQNGVLVIWAMSSSTSYEHISFNASDIAIGNVGSGFELKNYNASDLANSPHACTITDLDSYSTINVTLNIYNANTTYDYLTAQVSVSGE
jgi:hypothetical protein